MIWLLELAGIFHTSAAWGVNGTKRLFIVKYKSPKKSDFEISKVCNILRCQNVRYMYRRGVIVQA